MKDLEFVMVHAVNKDQDILLHVEFTIVWSDKPNVKVNALHI